MSEKETVESIKKEIEEYKRLSIKQNQDMEEQFAINQITKTANTRAIITWAISLLIAIVVVIRKDVVFEKETIGLIATSSFLAGAGIFVLLNSLFIFIGSFSDRIKSYSSTKVRRSAFILFLVAVVLFISCYLNAFRGGLLG